MTSPKSQTLPRAERRSTTRTVSHPQLHVRSVLSILAVCSTIRERQSALVGEGLLANRKTRR